MTDIVERLQAGCWGKSDPQIAGTMLEAADEIERLRALFQGILEKHVSDVTDEFLARYAIECARRALAIEPDKTAPR